MKNRGSLEFIDNINWWFWNGRTYPGLVTRETFSQVATDALGSKDKAELIRLMIADDVVGTSKSQERQSRIAQLLEEVGRFLEESENCSGCVLSEFEKDAFDALKAYISVLEYWGLPYRWADVVTPQNEPAIIVFAKSRPRLTVMKSELMFLHGRPYRFVANFRGATLKFEGTDESLVLSFRDYEAGQSKFSSLVV